MIAYTCQKENEFYGGTCVMFYIARTENGHAVHITRDWAGLSPVEYSGQWKFYVGENLIREHDLDALNAKSLNPPKGDRMAVGE